MAQTIGVGVIGMGWMGLVHSRSYRAIPVRFPDNGIRPRLEGAQARDGHEASDRPEQRQGPLLGLDDGWKDVR